MAFLTHNSLGPSHCYNVLAYMDKQRKEKDENLCDVRFLMANDCVYAHRSVLAACSAYFQGMLSGAFIESQGEGGTNSKMMEVDMSGCLSTVGDLDIFLSAVYTGNLELSNNNIMGVTELACFLLVEDVRNVCESFLVESLSIQNCLHALQLGYKYDLHCLLKACRSLLDSRFHDHFIHQQEMLATPAPCLRVLPDIYKYVHLHDTVQFLLHWVDRYWDVGQDMCVEEERTRRLTAACEILNHICLSLKESQLQHFSAQTLVGSADILEKLLNCCGDVVTHSSHVNYTKSGSSFGKRICPNNAEKLQSTANYSEIKVTEVDHKSKPYSISEVELHTVENKELHGDVSVASEAKQLDVSAGATNKLTGDFNKTSNQKTDQSSCTNNINTDSFCSLSQNCDDIHTPTFNNSMDSNTSCTDTENKLHTQSLYQNSDKISGDVHQVSGKKRSSESPSSPETCKQMKSEKNDLSDVSLDVSEVLVAFVPAMKAVKYFMATDCERGRPRYCAVELHVCLYHIQRQQWLWAGSAVFPEKFEDKDSWRVACVNCKAYFFSLSRHNLHVLDLKTMQWSKLGCGALLHNMSLRAKVKSWVPIAVNGKLHVLVSDKQPQDAGSSTLLTQQRYFRLEEDDTWKPIADVKHSHMATPLTLLSVSDQKVYVVKATIAWNLEKSMLIIQEGHIFDSLKEQVTKFNGTTYAASPMRVLVRNGCVHIVDGDSTDRKLRLDLQSWESRGVVNLQDIKLNRAATGESHMPCLTHSSAGLGGSAWEYAAFHKHHSVLTELRLDQDDQVYTVRHTPPPFQYVTIMTACHLSSQFVQSLQPCRYLHVQDVN